MCQLKLIIVTHLFLSLAINCLIGHSHRRNWPFCRTRIRIGAARVVVVDFPVVMWRSQLDFRFLVLVLRFRRKGKGSWAGAGGTANVNNTDTLSLSFVTHLPLFRLCVFCLLLKLCVLFGTVSRKKKDINACSWRALTTVHRDNKTCIFQDLDRIWMRNLLPVWPRWALNLEPKSAKGRLI